MKIIINSWKLESSLNALVHIKTGEVQRLGEFHYILLETLVQHAGDVLSRNFLINEVWKNRVVGNNSLPTAIYALRIALGDDGKQQEIIKTIPKKGYIFSKETLRLLDDEPLPNDEKTAESVVNTDPALTSNKQETAVPQQKKTTSFITKINGSRTLKIVIVITMAFIAIIVGYQLKPLTNTETSSHPPPAEQIALAMTDLTNQDTDNLKVFHVQHSGTERVAPPLITHAPEILAPLKQLLTDRDASATLYYYSSIRKVSVDILVKDQCQKEYQLIMNIENWSKNTTKLGLLIGHEVERTLNEMPACK